MVVVATALENRRARVKEEEKDFPLREEWLLREERGREDRETYDFCV